MSARKSQGAPPYSQEAEEATLGAVLVRPSVLDEVVDIITPAIFSGRPTAKFIRPCLTSRPRASRLTW